MTYMSRNPQVASVVLDDITTTTPSNPPSGKVKVVDRNGTLFVRNSSGAESAIGTNSSVGSGEKNYVENPSAAASISGWTNVGDLDVARTATAADLPRENTTKTGIKITADSNTQSTADYVYYDFTLDDVDAAGRIMKIKWDQKVTGTYTAGQLEVVITTQADRTTAVATPFTTAIPASDGTFQTYFLAPSTATCSLVIRATADMTTDGGIVISDVVVGPNVQVQGSAIGAWKAYTPSSSAGMGTLANAQFAWKEDGSDILVKFRFTSGTHTAVPASFALPVGYTTAGIPTINYVVGNFGTNQTPVDGNVIATPSDPYNVYLCPNNVSIDTVGNATQWANTTVFSGNVRVQVNELSSNVTLANRAVEEYASNSDTSDANNTSAFVYGPSGSTTPGALTAARTKRVRFQSPIQSTDSISIEFRRTTSDPWISLNSPNATSAVISLTWQGSTEYGIGWQAVSSTDIDVYFARYATTVGAGTYAAAGSAWSASAGYWRVRKVSGGASVGYPISSANIVGRTDGVAPAAGMVGEIQTAAATSVTATGVGSTAVICSLSLGVGTWLLVASTDCYMNARSGTAPVAGGVDLYNSTDASIVHNLPVLAYWGTATGDSDQPYFNGDISAPVTLTGTKTIQYRIKVTDLGGAIGSPTAVSRNNGKFYAIRIA